MFGGMVVVRGRGVALGERRDGPALLGGRDDRVRDAHAALHGDGVAGQGRGVGALDGEGLDGGGGGTGWAGGGGR